MGEDFFVGAAARAYEVEKAARCTALTEGDVEVPMEGRLRERHRVQIDCDIAAVGNGIRAQDLVETRAAST